MRLIRMAQLKEVFDAWALSEAKRFGYPETLKDTDLFFQHMKNRCYIYGDLLFAAPLKVSLMEFEEKDIKKFKFLRCMDSNGVEEQPSDIKKYLEKYKAFKDCKYRNTWQFIGVKRPNKSKITIIDGVHRFADWVRQFGSHHTIDNPKIETFRGYIIETDNKLREFE